MVAQILKVRQTQPKIIYLPRNSSTYNSSPSPFPPGFHEQSCGKHKRGERGSTEDTLSSPKRANMASEQLSDNEATEPTNQELKEMLLDIKSQITSVLLANNKLTKEMENLKSEIKSQRTEIDTWKASLVTSKNANIALKTSLGAAKKKISKQDEQIAELYDIQDKLEQYTTKQSLEIHGIPESAYTSTEEAVIKLANVLDVPMSCKDINISHTLKSKGVKPILVKCPSHKAKTRLYRARTKLKNFKVSQIFPEASAATCVASERIFVNENLTQFRKHIVTKANKKRKDGLLLSIWTLDGNSFVKTSPEGTPIRIFEESDLENI